MSRWRRSSAYPSAPSCPVCIGPENADGQRVVLYMCENETEGINTAFRFASDEGVSVFYWFDGPFSYALAGELGRDGMMGLAEAVYNQIVI